MSPSFFFLEVDFVLRFISAEHGRSSFRNPRRRNVRLLGSVNVRFSQQCFQRLCHVFFLSANTILLFCHMANRSLVQRIYSIELTDLNSDFCFAAGASLFEINFQKGPWSKYGLNSIVIWSSMAREAP